MLKQDTAKFILKQNILVENCHSYDMNS